MEKTETPVTPLLNPGLSEDEKLEQINCEWERLFEHFNRKAATGKKHFFFY